MQVDLESSAQSLRQSIRRQQSRNRTRATSILLRLACPSDRAMNCFSHDGHHWATPPLWPAHLPGFCFCQVSANLKTPLQNSNNNTYWCIRTVTPTANTIYCEYITGFVSYYDLKADPHQLRNAVYELTGEALRQLSAQLQRLKDCRGRHECDLTS